MSSELSPVRRVGQHGSNHHSSRRSDVYSSRRPAPRASVHRYTRVQLDRGTDAAGRFIGPRALANALRHFWGAKHRQGIHVEF